MSADDAELLSAIARGGNARRTATGELYRRYASRFRAYFRRRGSSMADAEELCQDAFIKITRACESAGQITQPRAWLWKLVHSVLIDHLRRTRPEAIPLEAWTEIADAHDTQAQAVDLADCVQRQFRSYASQHPAAAQAIYWAAVDQFTAPEIGELIGRSAGATREFLSQVRARLREYLAVCRDQLS